MKKEKKKKDLEKLSNFYVTEMIGEPHMRCGTLLLSLESFGGHFEHLIPHLNAK